ncbi:MAG: LCP family protein [Oscillospiraceae bacterium]|nr:LCP family protein [Oscillospiraceae bacterium]
MEKKKKFKIPFFGSRKNSHRRRRSNWYIYLISFAATLSLLCLIVLALSDVLFAGGNSNQPRNRYGGNSYYVPDASLDNTVLFMLSDEQGGVPDKFMLMNYRPRDEVIVLVPLNKQTLVASGGGASTLTELYSEGGAGLVTTGIEKTLGIKCGYYISLTRSSFLSLTDDLGLIAMSLPYDFVWGNSNFPAGDNKLTGNELFNYMFHADYPQAGSNFDLVITGSALTSFINYNLKELEPKTIQDTFKKILNNAATDMTFKAFTEYQQAFLYNSQNSTNPASYYIPTGVYDDENDEFSLSNQAIVEIINRFNLAGIS